jgi:hypothetical protein
MKSALEGLSTIGTVDVTRAGPDGNGGYNWFVTFTGSTGGDHETGLSGGDVPLLGFHSSLTGENPTGRVTELLAGSMSLLGKSPMVLVNRTVDSTTVAEVQTITSTVDPLIAEVQTVEITADADDLSGVFRLRFCDLSNQLPGTASVTHGSNVVQTTDDLSGHLSAGEDIKLGSSDYYRFFVGTDNVTATSVPLNRKWLGADDVGIPMYKCKWYLTGYLPYDISAKHLQAALEWSAAVGEVK